MAETGYIKYLREASVERLRGGIFTNLKEYKSSETDWAAELAEDEVRNSSITLERPLLLEMPEGKGSKSKDAENACTVYNAMGALTPQQATDERIWIYLTHVHCWEYVGKRWPLNDKLTEQKQQRYIRAHYFISGIRGLSRDNAISRLWWMGWIADRCTESLNCDLEDLLEVLLYRQDVRASLLERPGLSASPEIFKAVMRQLIADYEEINKKTEEVDEENKSRDNEDKGLLFQRDPFREMMKQLNRAGGNVVLNALETDELNALVTGIVQKIKKDNDDSA